jgi:uncharacterized protein
MKDRPAMVSALKLNIHDALPRLAPGALAAYATANEIDVCLLLPTAAPHRVSSENDRFVGFTREFAKLRTLATLHPMMRDPADEILRMFELGIFGFKFSSFSQRFDLLSPEFATLLVQVERLGSHRGIRPILVLDTFARADHYFGADRRHITIPSKLSHLVHRHPGMDFIGAHMGGLMADFDELRRSLIPASNLYLDTSNAAHTLNKDQFIELLHVHGSSNVLFGTDWPWFVQLSEKEKIHSLLSEAGYNHSERAAVFGGNAIRLFRFERTRESA